MINGSNNVSFNVLACLMNKWRSSKITQVHKEWSMINCQCPKNI